MHDSFLSNDSDHDMNKEAIKKPRIPNPERKMYVI